MVVFLIYLISLMTVGVVLLTRFHDPTLLFRLTREDGVVEWLTVFALLALCVFLLVQLRGHSSSAPRIVKPSAYLLSILCLLAAGEEISWGQRLFGFETPEQLKTINYQNEANLHNVVPAELFNGIIIFSVGIFFVLVPLLWRKFRTDVPWWIPSQELSLLTLSTILINHYRVSSLAEKVGLVFLVIILAWASVESFRQGQGPHIRACLLGWLTCATLYSCRYILHAANHQYEIRELLVILVVTRYCQDIFQGVTRKKPHPVKGGAHSAEAETT